MHSTTITVSELVSAIRELPDPEDYSVARCQHIALEGEIVRDPVENSTTFNALREAVFVREARGGFSYWKCFSPIEIL